MKTALTAGSASLLAPRLAFGAAEVPDEKVNLACVGIGNRGADVIKELHKTGLANIVALCDTDMGAPQTGEILKLFPDVPRFQDFRAMFDKMGKEIEAVCIGTPDFSHFPIAMLAMSLGKHVYCEKPMGQNYREIQLMMDAEAKYKVAAQMGNQGHSEANYFQFKAWTDAGIIKNVTKITAFMNSKRRWHGMKVTGFLPEEPTPESLDWDGWLATAPQHQYNKGYMNGEWRSWYDGQDNLPPLPADMGESITDANIPPPSTGKAETKSRPPGKVIYGEDLTFKGGSHATTLQILGPEAADMKSKLPKVPKSPSNHFKNFLLACQGKEKSRSPFSVAGPLCQAMAVGIIAQRVNAKLTFDPVTKQITNHKVANELLAGAPPRKDWEQYFKL